MNKCVYENGIFCSKIIRNYYVQLFEVICGQNAGIGIRFKYNGTNKIFILAKIVKLKISAQQTAEYVLTFSNSER
ncbi:hypothetical protein BpHYR1_007508 [Brachionus plicatilis]|uniref:Uncharacterized protein n=1 Tax=Brachionus plicatilis TaxID=10195 RepID=A0A3M7QUW2_BRAPC|nr:hypothetical protein BpHYR1_007508 [Brachionus plicatilis]